MDLLHHIFLGTAFLLLLYLDDLIFGLLLGLTSLSLIFLPSPLAWAVLWSHVHVAGTLYPLTFGCHLCLYLAFVLFSNHISFPFPFLSCSLAHSAAPVRLRMKWRAGNGSNNNLT